MATAVVALMTLAACSPDTATEPGAAAVSTTVTEATSAAPTRPPAMADEPVTTTTEDPGTAMPVRVIEPHRAEYRNGRLYLEGAVPSRRIADAFKARAAEVIGAAQVVDNYVIDPAAPEPTDGRVVVDEPLLFPVGSAEIDPRYYPIADLGVTVMRLNPPVVMRVIGYTDNVGTNQDNKALSDARARAVVDYMVARGIDRGRFQALGRGEARPLGSNRRVAGRQLNRRIEG
ncbi:MAG: OmpA family protein, partial [Acidimicrobiales bacterium]